MGQHRLGPQSAVVIFIPLIELISRLYRNPHGQNRVVPESLNCASKVREKL